MIPVDLCQNNEPVINSTTDDIRSNFEAFTMNRMYALYLTEGTRTEWLQRMDEYWNRVDKPYSGGFDFYPQWLFQYYNELPLGEAIESAYLTWEL